MKFKNMKIEINEQQPINEVVKELERLGYKQDELCEGWAKCIFAYNDGFYIEWKINIDKNFPLTTLAELKEM